MELTVVPSPIKQFSCHLISNLGFLVRRIRPDGWSAAG
jgi:hypothetical protein